MDIKLSTLSAAILTSTLMSASPTVSALSAIALEGEALYGNLCSGCHGSNPANNKRRIARGVTDTVIIGYHGTGKSTKAESAKISTYIDEVINGSPVTAPTAPPPPPPVQSGADLYAAACSGCHGSNPALNRNRIQNGVTSSVITGKHGTNYSSSAESIKIADYINGIVNPPVTPPVTPPPATTPPPPPVIPPSSNLLPVDFQDGVSPTASYQGTRDTTLSENNPDINYGLDHALLIDGDDPNPTNFDKTSLISWDISSIPSNATIDSVTITFDVQNRTDQQYGVYQALKPWTETGATWVNYAIGQSWSTAGANLVSEIIDNSGNVTTNANADRGVLVDTLSIVDTVSAASTGSVYQTLVVSLSSLGIDMVQNWVNGNQKNYGIIIADTNITNGLDLSSREAITPSSRPKLSVSYTVPNGAPSTGSTNNTSTPTDNNTKSGETIYSNVCSGCHGADPANGRNKIDRGTDATTIISKHSFVIRGDADKVAAYINFAINGTAAPAPVVIPPPSTPVISSNGAQLYADQCAVCHGANPANGDNKINLGIDKAVILAKHGFVIDADALEIASFIGNSIDSANNPNGGTGGNNASAQLYADLCSSCHGDDPAYNNFGILSAADDITKVTHYFVQQTDAEKIIPFLKERKAVADNPTSTSNTTDSSSTTDTTTSAPSSSGGGALSPLWLLLMGLLGFKRRD